MFPYCSNSKHQVWFLLTHPVYYYFSPVAVGEGNLVHNIKIVYLHRWAKGCKKVANNWQIHMMIILQAAYTTVRFWKLHPASAAAAFEFETAWEKKNLTSFCQYLTSVLHLIPIDLKKRCTTVRSLILLIRFGIYVRSFVCFLFVCKCVCVCDENVGIKSQIKNWSSDCMLQFHTRTHIHTNTHTHTWSTKTESFVWMTNHVCIHVYSYAVHACEAVWFCFTY